MSAVLNTLNAHNLPIFQPILMIRVSKVMVRRVLSDKIYLSLGLLSPLKRLYPYQILYPHLCIQMVTHSFIFSFKIFVYLQHSFHCFIYGTVNQINFSLLIICLSMSNVNFINQ